MMLGADEGLELKAILGWVDEGMVATMAPFIFEAEFARVGGDMCLVPVTVLKEDGFGVGECGTCS